jgi:hypothetical protein
MKSNKSFSIFYSVAEPALAAIRTATATLSNSVDGCTATQLPYATVI